MENKEAVKLSRGAYEVMTDGEEYEPFVNTQESVLEFSIKSVLFGVFFGIVFGAANAYLGLRAGLTISTSIPVAVMTVAAFKTIRRFGGTSNILEANLSQTF